MYFMYTLHVVFVNALKKNLAGKHQSGNVGSLKEKEGMMGYRMQGHDYGDDGGNHLTQIQTLGKAF